MLQREALRVFQAVGADLLRQLGLGLFRVCVYAPGLVGIGVGSTGDASPSPSVKTPRRQDPRHPVKAEAGIDFSHSTQFRDHWLLLRSRLDLLMLKAEIMNGNEMLFDLLLKN